MSGMDGDQSAKTFEDGANSAMNAQDFTEGIHEASEPKQDSGIGEKTEGAGTAALSADGPVGSQFTSEGAIGSVGESIGGPLSSEGSIGKEFTTEGSVGGTVQENAGKAEHERPE